MPATAPTEPERKLQPTRDIQDQIADLVGLAGHNRCDRCNGRGSTYRRSQGLLAGRKTAQGFNVARILTRLEKPTARQLQAIKDVGGLCPLDRALKLVGEIVDFLEVNVASR